MGVCASSDSAPSLDSPVDLSHFEVLRVLGRGGFGKVNAIERKSDKSLYALKAVNKAMILEKESNLYMCWLERKVMSQFNSPFLVNCIHAFQDPSNLYLAMPLMQGGDLRYYLRNQGSCSEDDAKFFMAEIILALEHLHELSIVYRDLKPENCLLDDDGHIRVSDFGLAAQIKSKDGKTSGYCGCLEENAFIHLADGKRVRVGDLPLSGPWPALMSQDGSPQSINTVYRGTCPTMFTVDSSLEGTQRYTVTPHHELTFQWAQSPHGVVEDGAFLIHYFDKEFERHCISSPVDEAPLAWAELNSLVQKGAVLCFGDVLKVTAEKTFYLAPDVQSALRPYCVSQRTLSFVGARGGHNAYQESTTREAVAPHTIPDFVDDLLSSCFTYDPSSSKVSPALSGHSVSTVIALSSTSSSSALSHVATMLNTTCPDISSSVLLCTVPSSPDHLDAYLNMLARLDVSHVVGAGSLVCALLKSRCETLRVSVDCHVEISVLSWKGRFFTLYSASAPVDVLSTSTLYSALHLAWESFQGVAADGQLRFRYSGMVPSSLAAARRTSWESLCGLRLDGHITLREVAEPTHWVGVIVQDARHNVVLADGTVTGNTQGYIAPEVIAKERYSYSPDYYSLGVLMYELLHRSIPPKNASSLPVSSRLSQQCRHLLKGLLSSNPEKRWGCRPGDNGWTTIKEADWFRGLDWDAAHSRRLKPPFKPNVAVANCFAASDSLVLTDKGFLSLDALRALPVLPQFAAFDTASQSLVYRSGTLVLPPAHEAPSTLITITGASAGASQHKLRITSNHNVFVSADSSKSFSKCPAGQLAFGQSGDDNLRMLGTPADSEFFVDVSVKAAVETPYDESVDGRLWCVTVDHPDHLVVAQAVERDATGAVVRTWAPIVVGQCDPIFELEEQIMNSGEGKGKKLTPEQQAHFQGWEFRTIPRKSPDGAGAIPSADAGYEDDNVAVNDFTKKIAAYQALSPTAFDGDVDAAGGIGGGDGSVSGPAAPIAAAASPSNSNAAKKPSSRAITLAGKSSIEDLQNEFGSEEEIRRRTHSTIKLNDEVPKGAGMKGARKPTGVATTITEEKGSVKQEGTDSQPTTGTPKTGNESDPASPKSLERASDSLRPSKQMELIELSVDGRQYPQAHDEHDPLNDIHLKVDGVVEAPGDRKIKEIAE